MSIHHRSGGKPHRMQTMQTPRRQRGVVLVISLVMLAAVTMLAIASINMSDGSLAVVSNKQSERRSLAAADREIETTLSSIDNFTAPTGNKASSNGVSVTRDAPRCVHSESLEGFSRNSPVALQHNYFEFSVQAEDGVDGGGNNIRTGVRVLMNANTCS